MKSKVSLLMRAAAERGRVGGCKKGSANRYKGQGWRWKILLCKGVVLRWRMKQNLTLVVIPSLEIPSVRLSVFTKILAADFVILWQRMLSIVVSLLCASVWIPMTRSHEKQTAFHTKLAFSDTSCSTFQCHFSTFSVDTYFAVVSMWHQCF